MALSFHELSGSSPWMNFYLNDFSVSTTFFVIANLRCQLDFIWNLLKLKVLGTDVKDFPNQIL